MSYGPTIEDYRSVSRYITEHPGQTYTEIFRGTGVGRSSVRTILDNMVDEGFADRVILFSSRTSRYFPTKSTYRMARAENFGKGRRIRA